MIMNYMQRAYEMKEKIIADRRHLHQNPELGFELPKTVAYVKGQLREMGLEPEDIGDHGVTATFGNPGGKTILLRADMDALPIKEKSGLEFAAEGPNSHACGHDVHTSILLGAAKLLKEDEDKLAGQVKLIFQPAEELLIGGGVMVDAGVLENPKVDAAMGLHVWPHAEESGLAVREGVFMASANNFRIKVTGVGAHGAMPYTGVDPVYIGSQIVTGVPEIIARELPFDQSAAITMGKFIGDGAVNVIPDEVLIEGTVRAFSNKTREYIKERLPELVQEIAEAYRGTAELEFLSDCPVLINDEAMTAKTRGYLEEAVDREFPIFEADQQHGSEDFAYYANEVPSTFFLLHVPHPEAEELHPVHHPEVLFDEEMIPVGVGAMAHSAARWLEENS